MKKNIQIITPVYNEEKNIHSTIKDFFTEYENSEFKISFIISEDGSTDDSIKIIQNLKKIYDIKLISSPIRKNYTDAVLIGLRDATSDIISFVDSDGQYDPKDLRKLFEKLQPGKVIVGFRYPRVDNIFRLLISGSFKKLYKFLLKIDLQDPSCGYFMAYRSDIDEIINKKEIGFIKEGFWWEFYAWCIKKNLEIVEIPIKHFNRKYDNTVVFRPRKIPGIAYRNIKGLIQLKKVLDN
jgi:glycosyltransferase involved in cell wall biosynthesis